MRQAPLVVPFLIDFEPTHIASWEVQSEAGPSRRIALAAPDNSIWVYPQSADVSCTSALESNSGQVLPQLRATGPTPSETGAIGGRPGNPRLSSFSQRSRAPSAASSTRTTSSKHRITSLSPPPPTASGLTSLSPTTATAAPSDGHGRASSLTGNAELLDHLREQTARNSYDGQTRSSIGLGINLGRKLDVAGHVDHGRESGAASPRSAKSSDSQNTTTIGERLMGWAKSSETTEEKNKKDLADQVAEIAVEREMQKESEEEAKQEEERKLIDAAIAKSAASPALTEASGSVPQGISVRRIILRNPGRGKVVAMKIFGELGLLCVLRDEGLLDIFRTEDFSIQSAVDLEEPEQRRAASSSKTPLHLSPFWKWDSLHILIQDSHHLLVAHGLPWSCGQQSHNGDVTRVVIISVDSAAQARVEAGLELPGQGYVGACVSHDQPFLLHSTPTFLTSYPILLRQDEIRTVPVRPTTPSTQTQNRAVSSAHASPRPDSLKPEAEEPLLKARRSFASLRDATESNPTEQQGFAKFLAAKKADWRGEKKAAEVVPEQARVQLGPGKEVVRDGAGHWRKVILHRDAMGIGLVDDAIEIFSFDGTNIRMEGTITLEPQVSARDVLLQAPLQSIIVLAEDKAHIYEIQEGLRPTKRVQCAHTDPVGTILSFRSTFLGSVDMSSPVANLQGSRLWVVGQEGVRQVDIRHGLSTSKLAIERTVDRGGQAQDVRMPSSSRSIWSSDRNGSVSRRSLLDILSVTASPENTAVEADRLDSSVTCMLIVELDKRYLIAGDKDGTVRVWDESSGQQQASWTMFADPVKSISMVNSPNAGVLEEHVLVFSCDGTVGVISLKGMEHLYLIPASRAPLRRVFVGGKDILLAYANGKARVWNVETMEFRRSTGIDAANEMLQSGHWSEVHLEGTSRSADGGLAPFLSNLPPASTDLGGTLICDPRKIFAEFKSLPTQEGLDAVRGLLGVLLTFDLNHDIDRTCTEKLGVLRPKHYPVVGQSHISGSTELSYTSGPSVWYSSPTETGLRQLLIVALLTPFLDHNDLERFAAQVIAFYTTSLPDDIEHAILDYFAAYYLDSTAEIQQAARMLFDSALDRMSEQEIQDLVTSCQPSLISSSNVTDDAASQALLTIGGISLHKYQSVSPSALKAASEAILRILRSSTSPHIILAIELCAKGFTTWQSYVDPMELLRCLFSLSTRKDSSSASAQARLAVLHVASSNPALFMSTLSMDILDAKSAEGRTSIMKLCVYMARKKPEVLENGLPRIAEAVVKSLDPNIGKMREDVWQAATVILNELVLAFSTIDFHSGTQKLAVGTHEGAVIMYELKTASRLYVLEPHRAPVSSVNFSPDGRRLLTVSLEEGAVTVWKVGSSLSGFFNVGGPPRQGTLGGNGPFKRIEFARIEDAPLKSTSALSDVHVSWPGARQAKVEIGEIAMSFES